MTSTEKKLYGYGMIAASTLVAAGSLFWAAVYGGIIATGIAMTRNRS